VDYCIGCGRLVWTPKNEHESGDWCPGRGDCDIKNWDGVNRLREALVRLVQASCIHEVAKTADGLVGSCVKCHLLM
jgi:hypothetical protein